MQCLTLVSEVSSEITNVWLKEPPPPALNLNVSRQETPPDGTRIQPETSVNQRELLWSYGGLLSAPVIKSECFSLIYLYDIV
jgi:hypothetical protein